MYDVAIIGAGLIGTAAARHLAQSGARVALIGPDEASADRQVHASHYDEGRITRTIDPDPVRAQDAAASIRRYRGIESASGIRFFTEVGAAIIAPLGSARLTDTDAVAAQAGVTIEPMDAAALSDRFGFAGVDGLAARFEPRGAGHISPRALVQAQTICAAQAGADVIRDEALAVEGTTVRCRDTTITAAQMLVTTGAHGGVAGPIPAQPLRVFARTVTFARVSAEQADRWAAMPSVLLDRLDGTDFYVLPPIRYPDGHIYVKIGGDPDDLRLTTPQQINDWFAGQGRPAARAYQEAALLELLPDLAGQPMTTAACMVAFGPGDRPVMDRLSDRLTVAVGGCGAAAKSSDELGRRAAEIAARTGLPD